MEINTVDQTINEFITTNVKMQHVPGHNDIDKEVVLEILETWAEQAQGLDFTNVSVLKVEIVFMGKHRKVKDD